MTQVSQRTRIGESIIRGIERDDFSACGDFYARGPIRAIAKAAGADPEPLVAEGDASRGTPRCIGCTVPPRGNLPGKQVVAASLQTARPP